jgi:iron complex transport system substrate-binding protein
MSIQRGIAAALLLWMLAPVRAADTAPRIVSLAPHLTELAYDAGIGDRLVGAVEWSDHPDAARALPRIGDAFRFDLEAIVRLEASDALAWQDGTPAAAVAALEDLGITVHSIRTRNLVEIGDALRRIGELGGRAEAGSAAANRFARQLQGFSGAEARKPDSNSTDGHSTDDSIDQASVAAIRLLYQISERPLFTLGASHVINEVFELCGAVNVFEDVDAAAITIDLEAALARRPLAIIAGSAGADPAALDLWRDNGGTPASRCGHLLAIDPDLLVRPTPRILEGARRLCAWLDQSVRLDPRPECRPGQQDLP